MLEHLLFGRPKAAISNRPGPILDREEPHVLLGSKHLEPVVKVADVEFRVKRLGLMLQIFQGCLVLQDEKDVKLEEICDHITRHSANDCAGENTDQFILV